MKIRFLLFSVVSVLTVSCSSSDDSGSSQTHSGNYADGTLVLNEGNATSGSVSFIPADNQSVSQDIFGTVNGSGQSIGGFVQSMFFDGDKAYIISNGSNKITVVDRYTFVYEATIDTGLSVPRYGVAYNGKAYVTNLAGFDTNADDYVAVIDLATNTVEAPIAVNDYADHIVQAGGKIYVANGSFGMGSKVSVIDPVSKTILATIDAGQSPNSMESYNGFVFVLCGSGSGNSKMVRINSADAENDDYNSVVFADELGNAQNLDIENNRVYFNVGPKVYDVALNAIAVNDTPIIDVSDSGPYVGYGFAVHGNRIYISDPAADFASDGKVYVYSTSGDLVSTLTAGLGPNGFYFN
jgi:YVTN family beta-propeller protein